MLPVFFAEVDGVFLERQIGHPLEADDLAIELLRRGQQLQQRHGGPLCDRRKHRQQQEAKSDESSHIWKAS